MENEHNKKSKEFEKEIRAFLSKYWNISLSERKIKIGTIEKKFDLVSSDEKIIGDAKYYTNIKDPAAKWSTIAEYVWLLEKTNAEKKFLVFGCDKEVPQRWLNRFGALTKVKFYYYKDELLTELN